MIYFMTHGEDESRFKIGHAKTPRERLYDLRTGDPFIRLAAQMEGTTQDEAALHRRFGAHRIEAVGSDEWFRTTPDLLDLVDRHRVTGEASEPVHPDKRDPEYRAERRASKRASAAKRMEDPEYRAARRADEARRMEDPEYRAEKRASKRASDRGRARRIDRRRGGPRGRPHGPHLPFGGS